MIYLIDDNQNNQREVNYNISFVDDGIFNDILTSIEKIPKTESLTDTSHLDFLRRAECILLHTTTEDYDFEEHKFLNGVRTNALKIQEIISLDGEKIPLVLFSNSMEQPIFGQPHNLNFIREIKKNIFYANLYDFLMHYRQTQEIELKIFAYGKSYTANEISRVSQEIFSNLNELQDDDYISISYLSPMLKLLNNFFQLSFGKEETLKIYEEIEDYPLTKKDFKQKINKITESFFKYGKNIYPW